MRLAGVLLVVAVTGASVFAGYWLLRDDSDEPEQAAAVPNPSPQPAPTLEPSPPPTPWPTPNDEPVPAEVQRVFDTIMGFRGHTAQMIDVVGQADWSCGTIGAVAADGGCGTAEPSFMANLSTAGGCELHYITDPAAAALLISDRLDGAAAWSTWALTRTPLFTDRPGGYVLAYRAATGNFGVLFYIDVDGYVVGIDSVCVTGVGIERQLATRVPNPDYILEPWRGHPGY